MNVDNILLYLDQYVVYEKDTGPPENAMRGLTLAMTEAVKEISVLIQGYAPWPQGVNDAMIKLLVSSMLLQNMVQGITQDRRFRTSQDVFEYCLRETRADIRRDAAQLDAASTGD